MTFLKRFLPSIRINNFARLVAYSLLPTMLLILGLLGGLLIFNANQQVPLSDEYLQINTENHRSIAIEIAQGIDEYLSRASDTLNILEKFIVEIVEENTISDRPSYYFNNTIDKESPNPVFSQKHNLTIDFSASSFNYYTNSSIGFYDWSLAVNRSIGITVELDTYLNSIYAYLPDILWIHTIYESGVTRSYPYHNTSYFVPQNLAWYNQINQSDENTEVTFSEPYVDEVTGKIVITAIKPIVINDELYGTFAIDLLASSVLRTFTDLINNGNNTAFVMTYDQKAVSHPNLIVPENGWNNSNYKVNITNVESSVDDFVSLVNTSTSEQAIVQGTAVFEDGELRIVTMVPLNTSAMIFGMVELQLGAEIEGGFDLVFLYGIPFAVFSLALGVFLLIQRQFGFLKGLSFDEFEKQIQKFDFKEAMSSIRDRIEEEVEEKIEDFKDRAEDKIDGVTEKLDQAEGLIEKIEDPQEAISETVDQVTETVEDIDLKEDSEATFDKNQSE